MPTFTRKELYDLVWSEPMSQIARRHGISDRGMAKACVAASIPVPGVGHWAKIQHGHIVSKPVLPPRGIGMSDNVTFGPSHENYRITATSDPGPEPVFEEGIDALVVRIREMVDRIPFRTSKAVSHPRIVRFLEKQEEYHVKRKARGWASAMFNDRPVFDSTFEHRRLMILDSLFNALQHISSIEPFIKGGSGRDLHAIVGDMTVSFTLDSTKAKHQIEREQNGYSFSPRSDNADMIFMIGHGKPSEFTKQVWQDTKKGTLEQSLPEIAFEIVLCGELYYRNNVRHSYDWRRKRIDDKKEEERKRQIEAERQRTERKAAHVKQCFNLLLSQAAANKQANEIRHWVETVRVSASYDSESPDFLAWQKWALSKADELDPLISGPRLEWPTDEPL